jgi:hypothetical protein
MAYAENTAVPVERSKTEIERILARYGADQFIYGTEPGRALIAFRAEGRQVRFVLPLPQLDDFDGTLGQRTKRYEQEQRRRWRALVLIVKAKLEAVETGIVTFEQEFLAHTVLPSGATVGEWMAPQLEAAYTSGEMPPLLALGSGR